MALSVLLLVVVLWVAFAVQRRWVRWRLQRRFRRAARAETEAARLLEQEGFTVRAAQQHRSYELLVDGRPQRIGLRADYLVVRGARTYVAEVKSGRRAPLLDTASTRRQLLEYLMAFEVDGVLLVDGETRRVHELVFPERAAARGTSWRPWWLLAWVVVAAVFALVCKMGGH